MKLVNLREIFMSRHQSKFHLNYLVNDKFFQNGEEENEGGDTPETHKPVVEEEAEEAVAPESPAETGMSELQMAVFANGDGDRTRRDTSQSSNSEDWRNKTANDLLVDLLDPVSHCHLIQGHYKAGQFGAYKATHRLIWEARILLGQ